MGQDIRINERQTWWDFRIDPGEDIIDVNLQEPKDMPVDTQFSTIGPLVYIDGFRCWWYQNPGDFYAIWPETQTYQPSRPTDVLYYNQKLVFRQPPRESYQVRISAYSYELEMEINSNIDQDYLWRYVAYGAALDILTDAGEFDLAAQVEVKYKKYRGMVLARTWNQNMNQRSTPSF